MTDKPGAPAPIALRLAEFACRTVQSEVPAEVRERARLLILDAIGVALAASRQPFAARMRRGLDALGAIDGGPGRFTVIGASNGLPLRDAVLLNAAQMHGLDFDDTHIESIIHASCVSLPVALTVGEHLDASGEDMLMAYLCAMEVAIRLGLAAQGGFHHRGLHATGVVAHFAAAVGAGRLFGLDVPEVAAAQGIVGSTATASQEFLRAGGWNKRLHPGWGAVAGITAAQLARHGFEAPPRPYEGQFGLFRTLVGTEPTAFDLALVTEGLGTRWETARTAVKPFPSCHATHAPADCALLLRARHGIDLRQIERIVVRIHEIGLPIVAEPAEEKKRPRDEYAAKFSVQFVVAAALHRGRFGLQELSEETFTDEAILATAAKVECEHDPDSAYPRAYSGGVRVIMRSGEVFEHHETINRGAASRALGAVEITEKFRDNAGPALGAERTDALCRMVLDLESVRAAQLMAALRA